MAKKLSEDLDLFWKNAGSFVFDAIGKDIVALLEEIKNGSKKTEDENKEKIEQLKARIKKAEDNGFTREKNGRTIIGDFRFTKINLFSS